MFIPGKMKAVLHGLSYYRLAATTPLVSRKWTGLGVAAAMPKYNIHSTAQRHFSVLTCGRPRSESLLNDLKKSQCQYETGQTLAGCTCQSGCPMFVRRYSAQTPYKKLKAFNPHHILMPSFPAVVIPSFTRILLQRDPSQIKVKGVANIEMVNDLDNDFEFEDFLQNANKGLFTVAKLMTSGKISELQELLTPEAYREVRMNYEKLTPEHHRMLHLMGEKQPYVVYQFHHARVVYKSSRSVVPGEDKVESDSKDVSEMLAKVQFTVTFLNAFGEEKQITHLITNTGGFERVYTTNVDSTWFKTQNIRVGKLSVNRMKSGDPAMLDFKSDDYWRIYGMTFGFVKNDFKKKYIWI